MKPQHILNFIFAGAIVVMAAMNIINSNIWHHDEHGADTTEVKPDTLTFEQEMEIVDSALKVQDGVIYKAILEVPNVEYSNGKHWYQTIVRYPNGMPKIVTLVDSNDERTEYFVRGFIFVFLDEHGRVIANGQHAKMFGYKWRWMCDVAKPGETLEDYFDFKDPNLCRNLNK